MGAYEARGTLAKAMHDLSVRWQDLKVSWNDSQAETIEKQYLGPLESDLRNAIAAMDQLAGLLSQAKRDCRDE